MVGKECREGTQISFAGLKILIQHLLGEKGKFSLNHMQKQPVLEEKKKRTGYQKTTHILKNVLSKVLNVFGCSALKFPSEVIQERLLKT